MLVHVPSAGTIENHWLKAQDDPTESHHFASDLTALINLIETDPDLANDEIPDAVDSVSHIHPFIAAVEALREWHIGDERFKHAAAAIHLLDLSIQRALEANHRAVFEHALVELVELQTPLSYSNRLELERALAYLYENHYEIEKDASGGRFHRLVDLVLDHADPDVPQERILLYRLFVICIVRGNRYADVDADDLSTAVSDIHSSLKAFEKAISIADQLDGDIDAGGVKRRYADEYRRYFSYQGKRDPVVKAMAISDGLKKQIIGETLSAEEKVEWQQEMQNGFTRGSQQLKQSGEALPAFPTEQVGDQAETLENIFKLITIRQDATSALYWLVNEPALLPPFEAAQQTQGGLINRVSRIHLEPSGHVTSLDADANITREYARDMLRTRVMVSGLIHKLIETGWVTERNFFELLNAIPGVTSHNLWYLTEVVNKVFDGDYMAAIHIGIPRLEATIYDVLNHQGNNVIRQMDWGTGTRTLSPLLDELSSYVSDDFHEYIEFAYADKQGEAAGGNLRNRVAHGHLRIGEDNHRNAILPLVDALRICYRVDRTPFVVRWGYPSRIAYLAGTMWESLFDPA